MSKPSSSSLPARAASVAASLALAAALALPGAAARADEAQQPAPSTAPSTPDPYHELETKYLFGPTEGADIGEEGEQSVEFETTGAFQKRHGGYSMIEQEFEFEGVPSQYFGYELSLHGTVHDIHNVDGLSDLNKVQFSGLSTELRFVLIGRGPGSPVGLTFAVEPEWSHVDGTSGLVTRDYSSTFRLIADTELVPNRLYGAVNLVYQPDDAKPVGTPSFQRTSLMGATGGVAYRVAPKVTVGGEMEYYRQYEGLIFNKSFDGHAVYAGPTLHIQFTSKIMLSASYQTQVYGRANGEDHSLDLTNFERHRANAKLEFEF